MPGKSFLTCEFLLRQHEKSNGSGLLYFASSLATLLPLWCVHCSRDHKVLMSDTSRFSLRKAYPKRPLIQWDHSFATPWRLTQDVNTTRCGHLHIQHSVPQCIQVFSSCLLEIPSSLCFPTYQVPEALSAVTCRSHARQQRCVVLKQRWCAACMS